MIRPVSVVVALLVAACGSWPGGGGSHDAGVDADVRCTLCSSPWGTQPAGCTDVRVDPANCGACDVTCASGACAAGACVEPTCDQTCDGTALCCGDGCVNPNRDLANCGRCGHACFGRETCDFGACECEAPNIRCNGLCVDAANDPMNCGTCGHSCDASAPVCADGVCVDCSVGLSPDFLNCAGQCEYRGSSANCGACGNVCASGSTGQCLYDHCQTCAEVGLGNCGGTCTDLTWSKDHCGACDHACGADEACVFGVCIVGDGAPATCGSIPCGPQNKVCCAGTTACLDLRFDWSACGACGHTCAAGEDCAWGVCVPSTGGGGGGD